MRSLNLQSSDQKGLFLGLLWRARARAPGASAPVPDSYSGLLAAGGPRVLIKPTQRAHGGPEVTRGTTRSGPEDRMRIKYHPPTDTDQIKYRPHTDTDQISPLRINPYIQAGSES